MKELRSRRRLEEANRTDSVGSQSQVFHMVYAQKKRNLETSGPGFSFDAVGVLLAQPCSGLEVGPPLSIQRPHDAHTYNETGRTLGGDDPRGNP